MNRFPALFTFLTLVAACSQAAEPVAQRTASSDGSLSARVFGTNGLGVRIREQPSTASQKLASLQDGDVVSISCQARGEHVDGTDVWDYIESARGYVLDAYLWTGRDGFVPGVKRCDADVQADAKATPTEKRPSTAGGGFSAIWGGGDAPINFEFNAYGGPDLYGYGTSYGLDGNGHTGIDVGVPFGTTLFAPTAGKLTCAGTNDGPGAGGGGCAAFNDTGDGGPGGAVQGVGRIELELDDGTVLILGHSRTCALRPGARVERGQQVGTSGGMNGAHVHVEARVRDAGTPSGWRIVDARTRLGD